MMQFEILEAENRQELKRKVNSFLQSLHDKKLAVMDYKFQFDPLAPLPYCWFGSYMTDSMVTVNAKVAKMPQNKPRKATLYKKKKNQKFRHGAIGQAPTENSCKGVKNDPSNQMHPTYEINPHDEVVKTIVDDTISRLGGFKDGDHTKTNDKQKRAEEYRQRIIALKQKKRWIK